MIIPFAPSQELLGELVIAVEARRGRPLNIAPPAMDSVKTWA